MIDMAAWPGLHPSAASWTFTVDACPDELLSSWLARSAHRHGTYPYPFLSYRFPGRAVWDRDIDLTVPPSFLAELERSASLETGTAVGLTLKPFADALCGFQRADPRSAHVPWLLSAGIRHRTRHLHGLQHCPACLLDGEPAFLRSWRLAFVVVCDRHGVVLRDGCPNCDAPLVPHRAPIDRFGRCHSCGDAIGAGRELSDGAAVRSATVMQRRCLSAFAAGAAKAPELPCPGSEFLILARTLASVMIPSSGLLHHGGDVRRSTGRRRQVERMRTIARINVLARLAAWTDDWPRSFSDQADRLGLTRLTFARLAIPPTLMAEVEKLPDGFRRRRKPWQSILDDYAMRRLRRSDKAAGRRLRAERLLVAAASSAG